MQINHSSKEIFNIVRSQFPQLSEPQLIEEIAQIGQIMSFESGSVIMNFDSYIKAVPLVYQGVVKVVRESDEDDKEIFLYYLYGGETCSMSFSCCMNNKRSDIKTIAEEDVSMIAIPIKQVGEWMGKYTSWRNFVMRTYDVRMQEMVKTIDSIAFKKMDDRLITYLNEKSKAINSKTLHIKHQEIASDLNASREAVSRLLKQLEKQGIVKLERNKISLL